MANMEKLNKDLDEVMNNMTPEKCDEWNKRRDDKLSEKFKKEYDEKIERAEELIIDLEERRT